MGPDDFALQIAVDGLQTAAHHFGAASYDSTRVARRFGQIFYEGWATAPKPAGPC